LPASSVTLPVTGQHHAPRLNQQPAAGKRVEKVVFACLILFGSKIMFLLNFSEKVFYTLGY
jgi:hypothetical protein